MMSSLLSGNMSICHWTWCFPLPLIYLQAAHGCLPSTNSWWRKQRTSWVWDLHTPPYVDIQSTIMHRDWEYVVYTHMTHIDVNSHGVGLQARDGSIIVGQCFHLWWLAVLGGSSFQAGIIVRPRATTYNKNMGENNEWWNSVWPSNLYVVITREIHRCQAANQVFMTVLWPLWLSFCTQHGFNMEYDNMILKIVPISANRFTKKWTSMLQ